MAGLSQIYADGFARDLIPRSTAPTFLSSTSYAVGDYVYYQGSLYRCTTAHTGTWVASHFTAVTVGSELKAKEASLQSEIDDVKSDLSDVQYSIANNFSATALYTKGEYCYYDGSLYVCKVDRHRGAWDGTHFQYTKVGSELWYMNNTVTSEIEALAEDVAENYAKIDGYYQNLTSGSAEQLISTVTIEDKVPYQFRTSGGSNDIGDREYDEIVGGSIVWNQLVGIPSESKSKTENGVTITDNRDGSYTVSAPSPGATANTYLALSNTGITSVIGHKYLYLCTPKGGGSGTYYSYAIGVGAININDDYGDGVIGVGVGEGAVSIVCTYIKSGTVISTPIVFRPQFIDLTQMFGSTIADYIYSLEQTTAGAGVAWFRKLFPKPYYAYNAGELKHVEGLTSHDMTGFNQWDEEWENGRFSLSTGEKSSGNGLANKNKIRVLPNTTYYATCGSGYGSTLVLLYYDASENFISYEVKYSLNTTFTTPSNAHFINFNLQTSSAVTTYNHDVCINLCWDGERDGEYEAYVKHSYPLDDSLVLRGIPKLDSNNQLYYDGDIYESDGTVTRKYGIVDMGTLNWELFPNYTSIFRCALPTGMKTVLNSQQAVLFNPKYTQVKGDSISTTEKGIAQLHQMYLVVNDSAYTSASAFKTALSGVYLLYELATPTTEQAEPYTNPQIVDDFGTEEYVTDSIVPVGHETYYMENLRAKLEMSPNSPSDNGDYIVRHADGENTYVPLVIPTKLPTAPSENGTYTLKVTVSNGTATYSWVSD